MAKTHKTEEVPKAEDSHTKALVQPFAAFKRPKKTSGTDNEVTISSVRFILPNHQAVDVPAGAYIVMGRQQGNDRQIDFDLSVLYGPESGVSRTHAVMQITETDVFVRDLDSTNGTYLNGAELYALRDYPVQDGDTLKLGSVIMRIIFVSA